ncbi:tyrosine-protein phosphatase non-receptor type substrate 1-like [Carassius auratus]|uniref:Tyrosine-protein phosphatase non-receptor type substrate 1-like n=1 Tax=Carassius auratus TaxID=7957 RepID=A0A6P6JXV7_CARAU|nr:tyrosine-protein phosphatase non-receptor type substrate 1-like [Carassius auratus]
MLRVKMFVLMPFLILLLTLDYSKGEVKMLPLVHQTLNCNERTVLQCSVSSSMPLNNVKVFWKKQEERDFECDPESKNNPPGFECNYTEETLTLTISNLTPANMGTYFCCIRTDSGHAKEKIDVSIGQCPGEFSNQMAVPGQVQCSFNGVYPKAMINWYHYDKNLTSNSTTTSLENSDGTFNITSVLNTQDKHKRYNCSLWSLKHGRYSDQEIEVEDQAKSSPVSGISTELCLSWALIFLSLMFSSRACLSL